MTATPPLILWGRCKGGGRWFWAARIVGGADRYGWAPNRNEAARKANAAAVLLAAGEYATIRISDDIAEMKLAAVTAARQREAKAEDKRRTAAGEDTANLYAVERGYYDFGARQWVPSRVLRLPIVKKTAKRIYYSRSSEPGEFETGYVDRLEFEAKGWVWSSRYLKITAEPPVLPPDVPIVPQYQRPASHVPDLKQLKAEMAAAHPDRGGSHEGFIAARKRYVTAKRIAGVR